MGDERLTVGSLFSGIGGFDLGFERAGFEIRWQVEIDPFCQSVLAKHWPHVKRYGDIQAVGGELERVDVICGGFPCQDISVAGSGDGLSGDRSGLWRDFGRLLGELRPRFIVVENVAALLVRGIEDVIGELARIGYDARWDVISCCAFGAPHVRRRVFIVAYTDSEHGRPRLRDSIAHGFRPLQEIDGFAGARAGYRERLANPSALYGGADGIPDRMERNRAIGNSVSPQIAQWIAERIKEADVMARVQGRTK
jgi:DNA (cytosine-5)-methyltransferase 1